jgi:hypothetical protein
MRNLTAFLLLFAASLETYGQTWTSVDNGLTNDWEDAGTWTGAAGFPSIDFAVGAPVGIAGFGADNAIIDGIVRLDSDVTLRTNDQITINEDATLIIDGTLTVATQGVLVNNGTLVVAGNLNLLGSVIFGTPELDNDAAVVVLGDFNNVNPFADGDVNEGTDSYFFIGGSNDTPGPTRTISEDSLVSLDPDLVDLINSELNETLPVELLSFEAEAINYGVEVSWSTATEINNDYFSILKSYDGVEFAEIGQVLGNGNSTDLHSYSFVDREMQEGLQFYQLIQYDYDGTAHDEGIISINVQTSQNAANYALYPNPALDIVYINGLQNSKDVVYAVFNTKGAQLKREVYEPNEGINILGLETGTYYILLQDGEVSKSLKLIKN